MNSKQIIGKMGENIVHRHLTNAGYRVLGRNIRLGKLELDILYIDGETAVICEVRTVSRLTFDQRNRVMPKNVNHETNPISAFITPRGFRDSADFISKKKRLNLLRAASVQRFMINNLNAAVGRGSDLRQRVDLFCVEVLADYTRCSIRHFKGI